MKTSNKAWTVLALGVLGYEILASEGELMSEAVDEWLIEHPYVTSGMIVVTAMHLLNMLHPNTDPYVLVLKGAKYGRGNLYRRHRDAAQ